MDEVWWFMQYVRLWKSLRPGTHYPHVTWAHVMLRVQFGCERRFNIELYGADSHFCPSAYVTWSHLELWSAHAPARLSNFCCRTHSHTFRETWPTCRVLFRHCYQLFPEMDEMLIEKARQRNFLYDTKSSDYRDQHMRANAWEEIGKEPKIKRKFYILSVGRPRRVSNYK